MYNYKIEIRGQEYNIKAENLSDMLEQVKPIMYANNRQISEKPVKH